MDMTSLKARMEAKKAEQKEANYASKRPPTGGAANQAKSPTMSQGRVKVAINPPPRAVYESSEEISEESSDEEYFLFVERNLGCKSAIAFVCSTKKNCTEARNHTRRNRRRISQLLSTTYRRFVRRLYSEERTSNQS